MKNAIELALLNRLESIIQKEINDYWEKMELSDTEKLREWWKAMATGANEALNCINAEQFAVQAVINTANKADKEEYRGNAPPKDAVAKSDGTYVEMIDGVERVWVNDIGGWRPEW